MTYCKLPVLKRFVWIFNDVLISQQEHKITLNVFFFHSGQHYEL